MKHFILVLLSCWLFPSLLLSQKETYNWFFGKNAGINFGTNPPTILTGGAINAREGVASISDPVTGQILFYTESTTVWDRNNVPMPNGTGLSGEEFAIAVPNPANSKKYYIFTTGIDRGFRYSEVDMTLNGGTGDVIAATKNTILIPTAISSEKVIAVKHCNGKDYWVITHTANDNNFYTYQVTAAGIQLPIVVGLGQVLRKIGGNFELTGYLKLSPNGKQLANAIGLEMDRANSQVEVYNFDNATGIISGPTYQLTGLYYPYGVEFSPNEQLLYVSDQHSNELSQFNLAAANVNASRVVLSKSPNLAFGAIQLTPYGNMYVAAENGYNVGYNYLGIIQFPDNIGLSCGYIQDGLYLNGEQTLIGLPTFTASFLKDTAGFKHIINCGTYSANFTTIYTGNINSVKWDFGDASPISTALNPTHNYVSPASYNVQEIVYRNCGINDTIKRQIVIPPVLTTPVDTSFCPGTNFKLPDGNIVTSPGTYTVVLKAVSGCDSLVAVNLTLKSTPVFNLGNDTALCNSAQLSLHPGNGYAAYLWQDGSTANSFTLNTPGLYWAEVKGLNGCRYRDTIVISGLPSPVFSLGKDTAICNNQNISIGANVPNANAYLWNTAATTSFISTNIQGQYWLEVKGTNGCVSRDTINVSVNPVSNFKLPPDTGYCRGSFLQIGTNINNATYLWSTGATSPTISVSTAGNYWVEVNNNGCKKRDTIVITENIPPSLAVSKSNDIDCNQPLAQLKVQGGSTYNWLPATGLSDPHGSNPTANIDTTTQYTVTGFDLNGCTASATVIVFVNKKGSGNAYPVANAFTPNGDGKNDCFSIKNWGALKSFELSVYNRWGQRVYFSNDPDGCWDGKFKGQPQPSGQFVYLIKAKSFCGDISKKGLFLLIR